MKFPRLDFDAKEYNEKITSLLLDKEYIIFIDTNFIKILFLLFPDAKKEIFGWLEKEKDRIRTPFWVACEY